MDNSDLESKLTIELFNEICGTGEELFKLLQAVAVSEKAHRTAHILSCCSQYWKERKVTVDQLRESHATNERTRKDDQDLDPDGQIF